MVSYFCAVALFGVFLWFFAELGRWGRGGVAACAVAFFVYGMVMHRRANILKAGLQGENTAADVLKGLPEGYTVVRNAVIEHQGRRSELDLIVVGKTGVFVVETKNMKGHIYGDCSDNMWRKEKHRGNNVYKDEFYSPVKQVSTHVYRLAGYLRERGVRVFVEGAVYFASEEAELHLKGKTEGISVLALSQGEDVLVEHIINRKSVLAETEVRKICKILK